MTWPQLPIDIPEALAICEAATPGEWRQGSIEKHHVFVESHGGDSLGHERVLLRMNQHFPHEHDARLIAYARSALPRALRELQAAREEVERLRVRGNGFREEFETMDVRHKAAQTEIDRLREAYHRVVAERDSLRAQLAEAIRERDEARAHDAANVTEYRLVEAATVEAIAEWLDSTRPGVMVDHADLAAAIRSELWRPTTPAASETQCADCHNFRCCCDELDVSAASEKGQADE